MSLPSSAPRLLVTVLVGAASLAFFGCSANVTITGSCEYNGETHDIGETFDAGDGCNSCTCDEGGTVACSLQDCEPCVGEEPDCGAPPPGCSLSYDCIDGSVQCVVECDACSEPPPFACDAPPGCFHTGPECTNGTWSCGELICEEPCGGPPPECEQPGSPNCNAYPVCTDYGWECVTECMHEDCLDLYPEGYEVLVHEVFQTCGCIAPSPCAAVCVMSGACETLDFNSPCGGCIQEAANDEHACVEEAAFGDACSSNPSCAGYIECVLSGM